jgi:hypothetical protein
MVKIPIDNAVLQSLMPKSHLIASKNEDLINKKFTLEDAIPLERETTTVDLGSGDTTREEARKARFRYTDKDGKYYVITIGALIYTKVKLPNVVEPTNILTLMDTKKAKFIPSSFKVISAENRKWTSKGLDGKYADKYPAYMYTRFVNRQTAKQNGDDFSKIITDFPFVNALFDDVIHPTFANRNCYKDIIVESVTF